MKSQNQSFQKRLKKYSLFSSSLVIASIADAQVIYTDVNPDAELFNSAQNYPFDQSYDLDLNNDGVVDFAIQLSSVVSATFGQLFYQEFIFPNVTGTVNDYHENSVAVKSDAQSYAVWPFGECELIEESLNNVAWDSSLGVFNYVFGNASGGLGPINDLIVGLELETDEGHYFGWVRMDVNPDSVRKLVIKDYAYEATPDIPIKAGDCAVSVEKFSNNIIRISPNPSTGKIILVTNNQLMGETELRVTDISGRKVFQKTITAPDGKFFLDLTSIQNGVYFITMVSDKASYTCTWIKQ